MTRDTGNKNLGYNQICFDTSWNKIPRPLNPYGSANSN